MAGTQSKVRRIGSRTIDSIRDDFPILNAGDSQGIEDGDADAAARFAYLDSAATSQKPTQVITAITDYYRESNANVHRALHRLAGAATAQFEGARKRIARFIGAESSKSIVFTRGATEAINLVVSSWGEANLTPGDIVLLTEMEHHANIVPWQMVAKRTGAELKYLGFDSQGRLDLNDLDDIWSDRIKIVALTHVSNVLGTINDIEAVTAYAHKRNVPVLIDAAQSVPHRPVDVTEIGCDFLVFSGHKMCGPTGIGVLFAREDLLEAMPPYMGGGEMIEAVWLDRATWSEIPHKFEAGTPNIAGAVGLGAAVDYLDELGMANIHSYLQELGGYAYEIISSIDGVTVYGPNRDREALVSFSIDGIHPHDVAQFLDREGVAVRAGHHCAHPLTRKLGVPATVRASFYIYSTFDEVDYLAESINKTKDFFHGV